MTAPSSIAWPPILFLAAIAIAAVLDVLYPLPWIPSPLSDILYALGWLCILAFAALYYTAITTMRRAKTTILPTRPSEHLVTKGPFSFSRNPIYLANTLLTIGIGLISGSLWFFLLALIAALLTLKLAIQPEEKHLQARFGKKYRDYAKRVRRWV